MILCVTLNSCLDKTLTVPDWKPGDNVRATTVREVVGGKGNNVSRALRRLGQTTRPVTFLGGVVGERCVALFAAEGIHDPILVSTQASTREIVTVRAPNVPATAFFDADPLITATEADALLVAVEIELAQGRVEALTLSGSSPTNTTDQTYCDMIALASAHHIPVFLDTYGPSLEAIWGFWPDTLSLNRREAGLLLRTKNPTDEEVKDLLKGWSRRGVRVAVVTDGPGAVLAQIEGRSYFVRPPEVHTINPIGSGDCLLAGLVNARLRGFDPAATLRHAVATAVANVLVWDAGAIDPADVSWLENKIKVETFNRAESAQSRPL